MRVNWERGTTLVEFALVLPILLLIIFGVLDLGWAIYAQNTLSLATRDAARIGIVNPDSSAIIQRVRDKSFALDVGEIHICYDSTGFCSADAGTRTVNAMITVSAVYTYTPITPVIGNMIGSGGVAIRTQSSMLVECQVCQ